MFAIVVMSLRAQRSNPEINSGIASVAALPRNDTYNYLCIL